MYCYRKVTEDLYWIGSNDRRLSVFEGVYKLQRGVSYNSYLLLDEKTVIFDTVDKAVSEVYLENIEKLLAGRELDLIFVHHMEPDHSATLGELLLRYPNAKVICNAKTAQFMKQFVGDCIAERIQTVAETDTVCTGKHTFAFVNAPFVHWPEVMMSYDTTDKILFSADAFGTFGALDGAMFADEVNFERDYLDEARRYYTNIVGKYGPQVSKVLAKAGALDIAMICPLHGFVWRNDIGWYLDKYIKWASYTPEENGVLLAYASVYGHTANAVDKLAIALRERGVKTEVIDLSMTEASYAIASVFKLSHAVFAAPTYNNGIFIKMEDFLHDLAAHNVQNRTLALIENGTWAPQSGKLMKALLEGCKNMTFVGETLTIKSAMTDDQNEMIEKLADEIAATVEK